MIFSRRSRRAWLAASAATSALYAGPALAQKPDAPVSVNIPAQPLAAALRELGREAKADILFSADAVANLHAPAVRGAMTPRAAAARLIANTPLRLQVDARGALIVRAPNPLRPVAMLQPVPSRTPSDPSSPPLAVSNSPPPAADNASAANIKPSSSTSPNPNTQPETAALPGTEREVVVVGTRRAAQTSINIKRNADTVVDTITASDIGAFPDKSVAEALERVPGVTVNRFAASDDTSHFSADPSGVLIRGLTQVFSLYNGRDTFSANSSRGLSFEDISPELMAGVDVYKNQTADLIEGGIAGTIDLRTRLPFDAKGQVLEMNVNADYGTLSERLTPEVSGIYSNRWDTNIGQFGVMADLAYSQVATQSQGVLYGREFAFNGVYGPGVQYLPSSVADRETNYDRERTGVSLAAQWRDPSNRILATAQYNRSQYHEIWRDRAIQTTLFSYFGLPTDFQYKVGGPNASAIPKPAPGTPDFTFDGGGQFETGTLVNQQTDFSWWGGATGPNPTGAYSGQIALNDRGQAMLLPCYSWGNANGGPGSCGPDARGPDLLAISRYNETHRMTQDGSLNVKFKVTDRLDVNLDGQYVDATLDNYDIEVGQGSFANPTVNATGDRPVLSFAAPTQINQSAGGLSNPNNYFYDYAMDHLERDEGREYALRLDANYRFGSDWFDSLKVGVRYADREQTVRYSAYNWGNITNNWNLTTGQYRYWNINDYTPDGTFKGYPPGLIDVRTLGGSFFGSTGQYAFFNMDALAKHAANGLSYDWIGVGQDQWEPICSNGGSSTTSGRVQETTGSCFRPDEINTVTEKTTAAYAMLKFGGPSARLFGLRISGNLGVRYVETEDTSDGSIVYPNQYTTTPSSTACTAPLPAPVAGQPAPTRPIACYLSAADLAFASGTGSLRSSGATHHNWLPSFNVRVDLTPEWLVRFAASRALSRPDIGYLKNYFVIGSTLPDPTSTTDPRITRDAAGNITGVTPTYQAGSYNPQLKPVTADQFDLSLEHYFKGTGALTLALFYKEFHDYIQYGEYFTDITNNGVTRSVDVRGPVNGQGAQIYGAEAAYQQFFDFLPGPWKGLGIETNFTYVENSGITNSGLKSQNGTNGGSEAQAGTGGSTLSVNSLEGLSKYAYNIVGKYEKYGLAVRLAYNWRSRFLVSAVDCCIYLPIYQDAFGTLDGSIQYALNPHLVLNLQASNLLNSETVLKQQVTAASAGGLLRPSSWFQNDRRIILGLRAKF